MAQTKVKLISDGVIVQGNLHASHGITTAHIGEGSNLYYTDARARGAVSVSGNALSYNSSTGVITSNFEESPTFTGNITFGDSHFIGDDANDNLLIQSSAGENIIINSLDETLFRIDGSTKMQIKSSGNVLIGTVTNTAKLNVGGKVKITDDLIMAQTNGRIDYDNGVSSGALRFFSTSGNTERMRINSAGNVGIGTTSPAYKLDIAGTSPRIRVQETSSNTAVTQIEVENSNGRGAMLGIGGSGRTDILTNRGYINAQAATDGLAIGTESTDPIIFYTQGLSASNEKMRIDSSGNVGIGTSSPEQKLHVEGASITVNRGNDDSSIAFQNSTSGATWRIGRDYSNSEALTFAYSATDYPSLTGNGLIYINTSGNVGIGMTSPSNKLEVAGDVAINTSSNSRLRFYQGGTFKAGIQAVDTGGQMIGSSAANDLAIRSQSNMLFSTGGNTERMRIFSNGNVNIGVAEAGASAVTGPFVVTHTSSRFLTASYEESAVSLSAKNGNNNLETLRLAGDSIKFFNGTNAVGSQKMVILNSGKVGIGLTSPTQPLHILGAGNYNPTSSGGGTTNGILIKGGADTGDGNYTAGIGFAFGTGTAAISGYQNGSDGDRVGLAFFTHGSGTGSAAANESMRIKSGGEVLIGEFAANNNIDPSLNGFGFQGNGLGTASCNFSNTNEMFVFNQRDGSGTTQIDFRNGNVERGKIQWTTSGTTYNTTSDYRVKENLKDFNGLNKVSKIKVYDFDWIESKKQDYGVIAHELQEILPLAVTGEKDGEKMQGVDYSKIVPLLVKAIQELKVEIEQLKNK